MLKGTNLEVARQPSAPRLYHGQRSHPIPVWNGILEHRPRIGEALWEFLWCLDRVTVERDGIGLVFGGAPVKLERIITDLGGDKETARRHIKKLESGKYIRTRRTPYGQVIEVLNSRKFGVLQKPQSAVSLVGEKLTGELEKPIYEAEKPIYEPEKLQKAVSKEDLTFNDLHSVRQTHTDLCDRLVQIWNLNSGTLPKIDELTVARRKCIIALTANQQDYVQKFEFAVKKAAGTPFLRGEGPRGWKADFDWMVSGDHIVRILEGVYESCLEPPANGNSRQTGAVHKPAGKVYPRALPALEGR